MAKNDKTDAPATKAPSSPPEDKAVKSPPESKGKKSDTVTAKVVRQPIMTPLGVKVAGETFECSKQDFARYGKLVAEA